MTSPGASCIFCFESHILIFANQACTPLVHRHTVTLDLKWISLLNLLLAVIVDTHAHAHTYSREPGGGGWPELTTWCAVISYPSHNALWHTCLQAQTTKGSPLSAEGMHRATRLCSDEAFYSHSALLPASCNPSSISISNTSDLLPLSESRRY